MTQDSAIDKETFLDLLEAELGDIEGGWPSSDNKFQIVSYKGNHEKRHQTLTSLGLSSPNLLNGVIIPKFELIAEFYDKSDENLMAYSMKQIGSFVVTGRMPIPKRGAFIETRALELPLPVPFAGLYFTNPVYRTQNFMEKLDELGVIAIGVFPISCYDLSILESSGWGKLEQFWDESTVDLLDIYR